MVMTAMSFKELEVNTRYGASFSIMDKILLEKSNLSGRNNISEEQAAPDWFVCVFDGEAVHSDPDCNSIADKPLKEKRWTKKQDFP